MFVHKAWRLRCLMATCVLTCVLSLVSSLFPYGTSAGDTANPQTTSASSGSVSVSPALLYYNNSYNQLYVNNDGFISFTGNGTVYSLTGDFPNSYPAICLFGSDIVPRADGRVWHRLSSAASDIEGVQNITGGYDLGGSGTFVPTWVLVASWVQVHSLPDSSTQGNTMQLAVASNGVTSVVMMEFSVISWVRDFIGSSSIRARVGFNKGNSLQSYVFPESKSEALFNLPNLTNVDHPGFFLFRVDEDIVVPSLITTTEATSIASTAPTTMTSPVTSTSTETPPAVTTTSTETTPAVTSTSTETTPAVTSTSTETTPAVTSSTETTPAVTTTSTETTSAVTSTSTETTFVVTSTLTLTTPAVPSTSTETTPAVTSTSTETTPAVTSSTETTPAVTSTSTETTPAVTSTSTETTPAVTSTSTETTPAVTSTSTKAIVTYSLRTETSTAAAATTTSIATDALTSEKAIVTSTATPYATSSPATSAAITTSVLTGEPAQSNQTEDFRAEDYYIGFGVGGGVALILLAVGAFLLARYFFRRSNRVNSVKHDESSRGLHESKSSRTHVTGTWQSGDSPYRIPRPRFSPRARR